MSDEEEGEDGALFESRVGTTLKDARESQNIALADIAKSTRIPLRQLENIEKSDYEALPAPTYSTGFVKAYAREIGLDQNEIAARFREEISFRTANEAAGDYFEPTDPARVPPRSLALIAAAIAIILAIGYGVWRSGMFGEGADDRQRLAAGADDRVVEQGSASSSGASAAPAPATGAVVLEATEAVWFRVYDLESGDRIYEAELQPGERYQVPSSAQNPAIRTGRADAIRVTVGGQRVAPLGPPETIISDVSLLPANLARRRSAGQSDNEG
ncbi:MAG: DUF4115 domain-containing protein [Sphingomonadaceae bacterium]|nr:DUF4115 domain-containing protein [Sphingomonadaceae bacterium]